jgi:cysteine desulfurase/selenocysteine lyase
MTVDPAAHRGAFPALDREVRGADLVYLDNAATTQTPRRVCEAMDAFYCDYGANVHRGIHDLSYEASVAYEEAHDRLAAFVGASGGREEMVFTKNTTESINLVAQAWGLRELGPDDAVVVTEMEHHASLVTWQQVAERTGADLRYVAVDDDGHLDLEDAKATIGPETAMLSVTHVSNVLGTVNPVADLAAMAHERDALVLVDGAQSVPTRPVDVEAMGADFLAFSGHKMAGPTGIGGLYGRKELLEGMEPFLYGGEMIRDVTKQSSTWNELPWKFEAGTPPIAEAIGLAAAADYLEEVGMDAVADHENELAQYALRKLAARDDVETYGPPPGEERAGLVSFNLDGVHAHDLSSVLNRRGIAIRAGDHCTQPLHDVLDVAGSARASFYVYNTREEVDALLAALDDAAEAVEEYMASDPWGETIPAHHRNPAHDGGLAAPDIRKHSAETSCGDEGEFHLDVAEGRVVDVAFESDACAVSQAAASVLSEHLRGMTLSDVADLDGDVLDLLDGEVPPLRMDCVLGPEEVVRVAAEEHLERGAEAAADD